MLDQVPQGTSATALAKFLRSGKALQEILQGLQASVPGMKGVVLADAKGLPVASSLRERLDLLTVAAMSALVAQSSQGVFRNMGLLGPHMIVLEGLDTQLVVTTLGGGAMNFIAVVEARANLGLVKLEMERAGLRIEAALGLGPTRGKVHDIFVMNKSGLLIRHYTRNPEPEIDSDIMGGMLVAIQEFVRDALRSREGNLDELQFGKYRIRILRGRFTILAAVITGEDASRASRVLQEALQEFEERHAGELGDWDGSMDSFPDIDEIFEGLLQEY
jgi:predicted regulator of Ras-like GTPase activity (Roadblock/LC7/MglB family)